MKKPRITKGNWHIQHYKHAVQVNTSKLRGVSKICAMGIEERKNNDAQAISALPDLIDIGLKIHRKLVDPYASVNLSDQEELAQALKKAGCKL